MDAPVKTLAQKAREIVGHEPYCYGERRGLENRCTCSPLPLPVRVAAGPGFEDLRKEHTSLGWIDHKRVCECCYSDFNLTRRCAPPLDAARAWRLLEMMPDDVSVSRCDEYSGYSPGWGALYDVEDRDERERIGFWSRDLKEVVGLLYEALHDAGLLT